MKTESLGVSGSKESRHQSGFLILKQYPRYSWLWSGQTLSVFGDALFIVALPWMAYIVTGSALILGMTSAATALPPLLLSFVAGSIVDRMNRRTVMMVSDLIRMLTLFVFGMVLGAPHVQAWTLIVLAFVEASAASFFKPARAAAIPQIVRADDLVPANALLSLSSQIASMVGPTVAGLLIGLGGRQLPFFLDGGTFILSVAAIWVMGPIASLAKSPESAKGIGAASRETLQFILKSRVIGALLLLQAVDAAIAMGPIFVGIPILVRHVLHLDSQVFGYVMSAFFAGMAISSAILSHWGKRFSKGRLIVWGYIGLGVTFAGFVFANSAVSVICVAALHGLFVPAVIIAMPALIQQKTPQNLLGRVYSIYGGIGTGFTALSAMAVGMAASFWSVRVLFAIAAVAFLVCAGLGRAVHELWETR